MRKEKVERKVWLPALKVMGVYAQQNVVKLSMISWHDNRDR